MVMYCCDLCGKRVFNSYKVSIPRLFPKCETYVMGQKVSQFGEEWRIVDLDLCEDCMKGIGKLTNEILREEI